MAEPIFNAATDQMLLDEPFDDYNTIDDFNANSITPGVHLGSLGQGQIVTGKNGVGHAHRTTYLNNVFQEIHKLQTMRDGHAFDQDAINPITDLTAGHTTVLQFDQLFNVFGGLGIYDNLTMKHIEFFQPVDSNLRQIIQFADHGTYFTDWETGCNLQTIGKNETAYPSGPGAGLTANAKTPFSHPAMFDLANSGQYYSTTVVFRTNTSLVQQDGFVRVWINGIEMIRVHSSAVNIAPPGAVGTAQGRPKPWCIADDIKNIGLNSAENGYNIGVAAIVLFHQLISFTGNGFNGGQSPAYTVDVDNYKLWVCDRNLNADIDGSGGGGGGGGGGGVPPTPVLTSIHVSPSTLSLIKGATSQLAITAADQNGAPFAVPSPLVPSSTNLNVASLSAAGLVTAVGAGTASVRESFGAIESNQATITVTDPPSPPTPVLTALVLTPSTVVLPHGGHQQLSIAAFDQFGAHMTLPGLIPQSTNSSVATFSANGVVTAVAEGTTQVSVSSGAVQSNLVDVTVNPIASTLTYLVFPVNSVTVKSGETVNIQLSALDQNKAHIAVPTPLQISMSNGNADAVDLGSGLIQITGISTVSSTADLSVSYGQLKAHRVQVSIVGAGKHGHGHGK